MAVYKLVTDQLLEKLRRLVDNLYFIRGSANGIATLDSTGKVPSSQIPSGGGGAITSVFGRTGVVVAASNDYTFAQVGSKPTTVTGYGITDAVKIAASGSVSNQATLDIDLSSLYSTYNVIEITILSLIPATNNVDLYLQVSADGVTFDSGANNYQWSFNYGSGGNGNTLDTGIKMGGNYGNGDVSHGIVKLFTLNNATKRPKLLCNFNETDASGNNVPINGAGARLNNQITKAVRILFSSGNITASYSIKVY